jgi:tRNA(Arg) A34 adenosine deaminase TadA
MMRDEEYLAESIALATESVEQGGGPFGAVVVKDGKIIGRGSNRVTLNNDPTAHAEVQAIRDACNAIQDFSLAGATLYASCEPCPMCLASIYWARLDRIVYAASREDAAVAGFDDGVIAREMALPPAQRSLQTQQLAVDGSLPFIRWREIEGKVEY